MCDYGWVLKRIFNLARYWIHIAGWKILTLKKQKLLWKLRTLYRNPSLMPAQWRNRYRKGEFIGRWLSNHCCLFSVASALSLCSISDVYSILGVKLTVVLFWGIWYWDTESSVQIHQSICSDLFCLYCISVHTWTWEGVPSIDTFLSYK